MRVEFDAEPPTALPDAFCWTKYGTEAGEPIATILARKEAERLANSGIFLWGIGNAVGPSVAQLLSEYPKPQVVFTPMLSKAARQDVSPGRTARWFRGVGLDGREYALPEQTMVTSRLSRAQAVHYALVCRTEESLIRPPDRTAPVFSAADLCNLRSGARVGSSQVTSVVRKIACAVSSVMAPYRVAFSAELVEPYVVRLTEGVEL